MKVSPLKIPDVKLIEPNVFKDDRGFFYESFNQHQFNEAIGDNITFVQDNHSKSFKGVLRGLHYQEIPFAQGKLVRVVSGEIFDVAVDIRKESPSCGEWVSEILSSKNKKQLWIPEGFAHGFVTLSDCAEIAYKVTNYYNSAYEKTINYNSPIFNIKWPVKTSQIVLSKKDTYGSDNIY
jgi:dTDP-4-dehydrorhamnose 3,5-epimerase